MGIREERTQNLLRPFYQKLVSDGPKRKGKIDKLSLSICCFLTMIPFTPRGNGMDPFAKNILSRLWSRWLGLQVSEFDNLINHFVRNKSVKWVSYPLGSYVRAWSFSKSYDISNRLLPTADLVSTFTHSIHPQLESFIPGFLIPLIILRYPPNRDVQT